MSSNIILCETGYYRSACVECQRRKQKASSDRIYSPVGSFTPSPTPPAAGAPSSHLHLNRRPPLGNIETLSSPKVATTCNREWPCDSCRRRKVPDGCRYNESSVQGESASASDKVDIFPDHSANRANLNASEGQVFEVLAERTFINLGIDSAPREDAPPEQTLDMVQLGSSIQFDRLIELLPQRRLMDDLIQLFINDVNFHYYIIYPPLFLQEYHIWWDRRAQSKPISLQYTCLLAMLCSCTIQHVADDLERAVLAEYREPIHPVSDKIHAAVRELSGVIPVGHYHMMNVQRLIHSCYWYKAEARFVEAWHVLNQAILEAKELELHIEPKPNAVSDFDREMRRRLWCILDTWDWQISSGLSRPKLIDRGGCTAELPELTLENYDPSPMEHMKMQSQLTRELATRFGAPKNIISTQEVQEYKEIILSWVRRFPKIYDFYDPDMSRDSVHPWIFPHRFYLYTMACLLILNPIRHYMVKSYTKDSPADDLTCRADGLFFSLILLKTQRKWVDKINGRDGRLHFIVFSIFDTAAILCTALVKDHANTIENKEDVLHAIAESTAMLKALVNISETAKMSHDILYRLTKKLKKPSASKESGDTGRKRTKIVPVAPSQSTSSKASPAAASTKQKGAAPKINQSRASTKVASNASQSLPNGTASQSMPGANTSQSSSAGYVSSEQANPDSYSISSTNFDGYSNLPPQLDAYSHPPATAPPMPAHVSASAAAHTMVQPVPRVNAPQMAHQPMPRMAGDQNGHSMPQQSTMHMQIPMPMANPSYFQLMHPSMPPSLEPNPPLDYNSPQPGPAVQPVGYAQPPPLGTGIFNMNVADGVPAIANLWDAPAGPIAPVISYSILGHNVPVNVVPQPRELYIGQQQEHIVPELNLSNLTEADIGGLAPLWSWHSSNLFPDDTQNGPPA
ncbi:Fungal specific transcription factor [Cordyceps fumosorosea ARSEF 2679]|uniref:Fungal specific transcription factor n=1 Tax=Cordyceps fumosorosea (strain ARSEF 2679) TaxID=1081104 RepID=A0A168ETW9_CORFA|nr:Fungal specific transcription factor [Cordyceps fumosorosea ARSEF 2679]OAA74217.1 Fungal specific transcription factor [Cordyceps fumosorosea ARSEF 2679]